MKLTKEEIQRLTDMVYAEMKKADEDGKIEKADKLEVLYEKLRAELNK